VFTALRLLQYVPEVRELTLESRHHRTEQIRMLETLARKRGVPKFS
jgi:hypothetical protein